LRGVFHDDDGVLFLPFNVVQFSTLRAAE
jgi:hypothetical protein